MFSGRSTSVRVATASSIASLVEPHRGQVSPPLTSRCQTMGSVTVAVVAAAGSHEDRIRMSLWSASLHLRDSMCALSALLISSNSVRDRGRAKGPRPVVPTGVGPPATTTRAPRALRRSRTRRSTRRPGPSRLHHTGSSSSTRNAPTSSAPVGTGRSAAPANDERPGVADCGRGEDGASDRTSDVAGGASDPAIGCSGPWSRWRSLRRPSVTRHRASC